jgi:hypothetical protein
VANLPEAVAEQVGDGVHAANERNGQEGEPEHARTLDRRLDGVVRAPETDRSPVCRFGPGGVAFHTPLPLWGSVV